MAGCCRRPISCFGYAPWSAQAPAGFTRPGNDLLGDIPQVFYPFLSETAASLRSGRLPTWTNAIFGGHPFLASYQTSTFSVFTLPALVLAAGGGAARRRDAPLLVGAVGMWLFLRRSASRPRPSGSAPSRGCSTRSASCGSSTRSSNVSPWLPFLLLERRSSARVARGARRRPPRRHRRRRDPRRPSRDELQGPALRRRLRRDRACRRSAARRGNGCGVARSRLAVRAGGRARLRASRDSARALRRVPDAKLRLGVPARGHDQHLPGADRDGWSRRSCRTSSAIRRRASTVPAEFAWRALELQRAADLPWHRRVDAGRSSASWRRVERGACASSPRAPSSRRC